MTKNSQHQQTMTRYLVGGAVRDKLLQLPVKDRDWVLVGATSKDIEELMETGYQQVGKDFPVFLHPQTKEEYALARKERKTGVGYKGFDFDTEEVTLEEDLLRRDLTINAIAEAETGELIDPFQGQKDLKQKILRHVSPAFAEDPLRVLRVARFAARYASMGFTIAPETKKLMQQIVNAGELQHLSGERVWQEFYKALGEHSPRSFIEVLHETGALQELMPELNQLDGVPQPPKHHPEIDTFDHVLRSLDQAVLLTQNNSTSFDEDEKKAVCFATLLHDLGKGITPKELLPKHHEHEEKGLPLVKAVCARFKIPKMHTQLALYACAEHLNCHKALELKPSTILKLLRRIDYFRKPQNLKLLLLVCEADSKRT